MTAAMQLHRKHALDIWIEDQQSTRLLLEWHGNWRPSNGTDKSS